MKQRRDLTTWLNFVDCTEIKAFVELTVTRTIRAGAQNLLMVIAFFGFLVTSFNTTSLRLYATVCYSLIHTALKFSEACKQEKATAK